MNIEVIRGDTNTFLVTFVRNNAVVSLVGAKMWFTVKDKATDPDVNAIIALNSVDNSDQIVSSFPTSGQFQIQLTDADTDLLVKTAYLYDVQVKEANGTVTTVQRGKLKVVRDITRTST